MTFKLLLPAPQVMLTPQAAGVDHALKTARHMIMHTRQTSTIGLHEGYGADLYRGGRH